MSLDLRGYSAFHEILYSDRMDIASTEETTDNDGATHNRYPKVPQQKDVPCKLSLAAGDVPSEEFHEKRTLFPKVFCSPKITIKAGDRITVRKCHADGTVYATFQGCISEAGMPNVYSNHQEFELRTEGDA